MDRIKSQREEWITSQSVMDVGEGQQQPRQLIQGTDNTGNKSPRFLQEFGNIINNGAILYNLF